MKLFSNKYVFISVSSNGRWFSLNLEMNFMPTNLGRWRKNIIITWPRIFKKVRPIEQYKLRGDKYNPHCWEVGDKNLLKKDFSILIEKSGLKIVNSSHNEFFTNHLFYFMEKKK
jgi:hypothetical protein